MDSNVLIDEAKVAERTLDFAGKNNECVICGNKNAGALFDRALSEKFYICESCDRYKKIVRNPLATNREESIAALNRNKDMRLPGVDQIISLWISGEKIYSFIQKEGLKYSVHGVDSYLHVYKNRIEQLNEGMDGRLDTPDCIVKDIKNIRLSYSRCYGTDYGILKIKRNGEAEDLISFSFYYNQNDDMDEVVRYIEHRRDLYERDDFNEANDPDGTNNPDMIPVAEKITVADGDDKDNDAAENDTSFISVADEIRKMHDLKEEGIITEEEFAAFKRKYIY